MKSTPYAGRKASSTSGFFTMCETPMAAMERNHAIITGPKNAPTFAVPWLWMKKSTAITARVIGITYGLNLGEYSSRPSMAESTVIDGVIMLSP